MKQGFQPYRVTVVQSDFSMLTAAIFFDNLVFYSFYLFEIYDWILGQSTTVFSSLIAKVETE